MKPVDVRSNTYIGTSKEINNKASKVKTGDIARISKYKNIFTKDYTPNWSEEASVMEKVKDTVPWTCVINYLNAVTLVAAFKMVKMNQKDFQIGKKSRDKLWFIWKG